MIQPLSASRLIWRWAVGLLGAWVLTWLAAPWIVDSILVRVEDPDLQLVTLREGDVIRWRGEGWARTKVGPYGLPGWTPNGAAERLVLWGDSQVEGFCVNDDEKIGHQLVSMAQRELKRTIECIPFGRSGTDAIDWIDQLKAVDQHLRPEFHVWIVAELSDLQCLSDGKQGRGTVSRWKKPSNHWIAVAKDWRAETAFHVARRLLLDPITGQLRSLRWSLGPIRNTNLSPQTPHTGTVSSGAADADVAGTTQSRPDPTAVVADVILKVNESLHNRLIVLYAPAVPRFAADIAMTHPDDAAWERLASALADRKVRVVDCRPRFREHWDQHGTITRGFHNGTPSYGHLNATGNRLIGEAILDALRNAHDGANSHAMAGQ